jgi:hypothetical protein
MIQELHTKNSILIHPTIQNKHAVSTSTPKEIANSKTK